MRPFFVMSLCLAAWGGIATDTSAGTTAPAGNAAKDAIHLLQRVAIASQKLNYTGTFVYRSGNQTEVSRIVHQANNGSQSERLEVLDGSPRELVRHNDEVKCFLPEDRLVIVEPRGQRRSFPALLPASLAGLSEHYRIAKGGQARISGFDSQIVRLEPRDAFRYGHQYWIELNSGMLLKGEVFDARGTVLESIAFTELRIGETASAEIGKHGIEGSNPASDSWKVRQARLSEIRDVVPWQFRSGLPGFRRQSAMRREILQNGVPMQKMLHWVYSDGLSAYSIFISPQRAGEPVDEGGQVMGAVSMARRLVDGHEVVVVGDIPPVAIQQLATGVVGRGK